MELRKGYKQTEVGVLPEDWEPIRLRSLLNEAPKYGINAASVELEGNLPVYIRITDIDENGYFSPSKIVGVNNEFSENYVVADGDILLARTGASVGKSYIYNSDDGKLVYAGFLIKVSPNKDKLESQYLFQFLKTAQYWSWVTVMSMRSGQPGINGNEYGQLQIPLPPTKTEQTAIANALSDVDALIQSLTRLIAKKRQIKQGAMQTLLNPYENGCLKAGWVVKKLGDVAHVEMGQSPSSQNYNYKGVGLPLVQGNADIKNRKTIIRTYTSEITKKCNFGDIIMSVRAPVGEIAVSSFEACIGRGVCAINYPNKYIYHYLISIESGWGKLSKGSTFDSVTSTEVKELDISIPENTSEQVHIASILSDMDVDIAALESKLAKTQQIKQGMMQNLLTGKIRLV